MTETPTIEKTPEQAKIAELQAKLFDANRELIRSRDILMYLAEWRENTKEEYIKENDGEELPSDTFQDQDQWDEVAEVCKRAETRIWNFLVTSGHLKGCKCK